MRGQDLIRLRAVLLLACATGLWAQTEYGGPTIMSRSSVVNSPPIGGLTSSFVPFASISALVDTGLTRPAITPNGTLSTLNTVNDQGMLAEVGLTGRHRWKKTSLWLDYRGHFRSYVNTSNLDTTDQFLTLGLVHQQSRRVQFIVRESGGTYTRITTC
jgi:hypothetical protein